MPDKRLIIIALATAIFSAFLIVFLTAESARADMEVCDLKDNDGDGEVDEGFAITCRNDSQCGPSGLYGDKYCKDDGVWQGHYESSCAGKEGTCLSECSSRQTERLIEPCDNGCESGACV